MFKEGDKVPTFSIITDKKEFILKEINTYKTVLFFQVEFCKFPPGKMVVF